jgi:hypothetical protein
MVPLAGYVVGDPQQPDEAHGDFVVGDRSPTDGWAMSSTVGAFPWYYAISPEGKLIQGSNVFELCAAACLKWEWNMTAIRQIATVGHTLGLHTLHPRIFRLPSHSKLTLANGSAKLECLDSLATWDWDTTDVDSSFGTLTDAFDVCIEGMRSPILSLSAGFDSRLLLALSLRLGCSPLISSMGSAGATDVKIATMLARRVGLKIERIDLTALDYLKYGEQISKVTSGAKTASDWHTWLYNKNIGVTDCVHLVGSNGEFARTFYSDALTRSKMFRGSGRRGASAYFAVKALNRSRKYRHVFQVFSPVGIMSVLKSIRLPRQEYPNSALVCLDTFYAIERVRHFIGSGLACYAQFNKPRSPFLDKRWMKSIAATRRSWKEGNRYHLAAIDKFCPQLLDIPFNRDPDGGATIAYSPFAELARTREVEDLLVESSALDFLLDRRARIAAMRHPGADRTSVVSLFLTMHFASINARRLIAAQ